MEMLAIVYVFYKWRYFVLRTAHKTTIFSDHQNFEYFTLKVTLNRIQARWAEILLEFAFIIIYQKESVNVKVDILSRCPAYTVKKGGTTAISEKPMLRPKQWFRC